MPVRARSPAKCGLPRHINPLHNVLVVIRCQRNSAGVRWRADVLGLRGKGEERWFTCGERNVTINIRNDGSISATTERGNR